MSKIVITRARASRAAYAKIVTRQSEVICELLAIAANRLAALPASPPTPATPTAAAHQPKQQKKHHRANKGVDDQGNDPAAKMDADLRQQPVTDKRAEDY